MSGHSSTSNNKFVLLKSFLIVFYLAFITWAGFAHLFNWPYAVFSYPWFNFGMASFYPDYYRELVVLGVRRDRVTVVFNLQEFFPMPHNFIERGGGGTIGHSLYEFSPTSRGRLAKRLCAYLMDRYNSRISEDPSKLTSAKVKLIFWSLNQGGKIKSEKTLAECS